MTLTPRQAAELARIRANPTPPPPAPDCNSWKDPAWLEAWLKSDPDMLEAHPLWLDDLATVRGPVIVQQPKPQLPPKKADPLAEIRKYAHNHGLSIAQAKQALEKR